MRTDLAFRPLALEAFSFLVEGFSFSDSGSTPDRLDFERGEVVVSVWFDRPRNEVDASIGLSSSEDLAFGVGEIVRYYTGRVASAWQASDPAGLEHCLAEIATLLREHGAALLRGSSEEFHRLAADRRELFTRRRRARQVEDARQAARVAWKAEDFRAVVHHLQPVAEDLPPSDSKRLELARRRRKDR